MNKQISVNMSIRPHFGDNALHWLIAAAGLVFFAYAAFQAVWSLLYQESGLIEEDAIPFFLTALAGLGFFLLCIFKVSNPLSKPLLRELVFDTEKNELYFLTGTSGIKKTVSTLSSVTRFEVRFFDNQNSPAPRTGAGSVTVSFTPLEQFGGAVTVQKQQNNSYDFHYRLSAMPGDIYIEDSKNRKQTEKLCRQLNEALQKVRT